MQHDNCVLTFVKTMVFFGPEVCLKERMDRPDSAQQPGLALGSITGLYQRFRDGDERAVAELWDRFCPRLLGLARASLRGRALGISDSNDVAQSAFASFWKGASAGKFDDPTNRDNLWNLMGIITVRKARKLVERELAAKRGSGRRDGVPVEDHPLAAPDTVGLEMLCNELFDLLDDELRQFAALRLLGYTNGEIARLENCSERKVERKLHLIRAVWEQELSPSE
jgi:DNA-directed RNA polymerase specialized sigma24 family protein